MEVGAQSHLPALRAALRHELHSLLTVDFSGGELVGQSLVDCGEAGAASHQDHMPDVVPWDFGSDQRQSLLHHVHASLQERPTSVDVLVFGNDDVSLVVIRIVAHIDGDACRRVEHLLLFDERVHQLQLLLLQSLRRNASKHLAVEGLSEVLLHHL